KPKPTAKPAHTTSCRTRALSEGTNVAPMIVARVPKMKKSYHSKTVPADEAAMTSRMSRALGRSAGVVAAMVAIALFLPAGGELARSRRAGKGGNRRLPRQQYRPVAGRIVARGFEHSEVGPLGQRSVTRQPALDLVERTRHRLGIESGCVPRENRCRRLPDGAGAYDHAETGDPASLIEREIHRQRAAACRRPRFASHGSTLEPRPASEFDCEREQFGRVEALRAHGASAASSSTASPFSQRWRSPINCTSSSALAFTNG